MNLEKQLNQVKNRIGLVGGPLILNSVTNAEHNISASIDPRDWHIELNIVKDWNPAPDKETRNYLKQKNVSDALWTVTRDVVYHECAHWALPRGSKYGCPRSSELHDIIKDAVVQARTEKKRKRNEDLEHYIANSFEDLFDNTFCRVNPSRELQTTHTGQILFYNDNGFKRNEKKELVIEKYTPFYEAFVKLNLFLWGNEYDERLLIRFFNNDKKTIKAVQEVISKLNLKQKYNDGQITYFAQDKVVEMLCDESKWFELAKQYTLIIDELAKEQMPKELLFGVCSPSGSDERLCGEKEKIIVKRFRTGRGKTSYMDSFEYLDGLYRSLGREIPVKVELFREVHSFPVAHYGSQAFDAEVHDFARVKLSRVGIDEHGEINFQTYRGDITIPAQYVKNLRGFPNLRIVNLDTSYSMKEPLFGDDEGRIVNPFAKKEQQWGENSKYHHALIGKYGIDAYLEMQGIAGDVDSILINVSSSSIPSKRQTMASRREENKLALSPQFGNTYIDCDTLENALSLDSCFVLSLSDGEFLNWDKWYKEPVYEKDNKGNVNVDEKDNPVTKVPGVKVSKQFKEIISKHAYAHIQMGTPNEFTNDLQKWGIPVYFVNQQNPVEKLMVDVTQKHYEKFAMEELQNA